MMKLHYYLTRYPVSIVVVAVVIYLSFFRTPSTDLGSVPGFDKVVHMCMYFGLSGVLWLEFRRAHRRSSAPRWHAWVGAFVCPLLFSGTVELLQAWCTDYRSGDWLDFAANACGVVLASAIGHRLAFGPGKS